MILGSMPITRVGSLSVTLFVMTCPSQVLLKCLRLSAENCFPFNTRDRTNARTKNKSDAVGSRPCKDDVDRRFPLPILMDLQPSSHHSSTRCTVYTRVYVCNCSTYEEQQEQEQLFVFGVVVVGFSFPWWSSSPCAALNCFNSLTDGSKIKFNYGNKFFCFSVLKLLSTLLLTASLPSYPPSFTKC